MLPPAFQVSVVEPLLSECVLALGKARGFGGSLKHDGLDRRQVDDALSPRPLENLPEGLRDGGGHNRSDLDRLEMGQIVDVLVHVPDVRTERVHGLGRQDVRRVRTEPRGSSEEQRPRFLVEVVLDDAAESVRFPVAAEPRVVAFVDEQRDIPKAA